MSGSHRSWRRLWPRRRLARVLVLLGALSAFVVPGALGAVGYLGNYWVYRGYLPPRDPAYVSTRGSVQNLTVASPALGGRRQQVIVYLPPGYTQHRASRYPVFYLLHGFPGRPAAFLETVRMGVVEDVLVARHKIPPMILVMPFGSTGTFTDVEWANGVSPNSGWETFVSRDLVRAIDARYRTIRAGSARALGGLSEGGYGAFNIGLHHPGEFGLLESWSGYARAFNVKSVFGGLKRELALNSPLLQLPKRARGLRRAGTFFWFYSGRADKLEPQNTAFARALAAAGLPFRYFTVAGNHDWSLWRGNAANSLLAAGKHLARA